MKLLRDIGNGALLQQQFQLQNSNFNEKIFRYKIIATNFVKFYKTNLHATVSDASGVSIFMLTMFLHNGQMPVQSRQQKPQKSRILESQNLHCYYVTVYFVKNFSSYFYNWSIFLFGEKTSKLIGCFFFLFSLKRN